MVRVDTSPDIAAVQNLQATGDRPIVDFPTDAMGVFNLCILRAEHLAVAALGYAGLPQPASVIASLLHMTPESLCG